MADITGQEIFAVGKWNGLKFTESDLDDIAKTFDKLAAVGKVPLKLGHNPEQAVTDGQPALGWVRAVYRKGKKLLADFADVPEVIVKAIRSRLYRSVSIELLRDVEYKGNKYSNVLDAVALLGADKPAVNTLADLEAYMTRADFSGGQHVVFSTVPGKFINGNTEAPEMDAKAVEEAIAKAIAPLQAELSETKTENETLKADRAKFERDKEEAEKAAKAKKVTEARESVKAIFERAVTEKLITPAQRESYTKLVKLDDDEAVLEIDEKDIETMLKLETRKEEGDSARFKRKDDSDLPASVQLDRMTHESMVRSGEVDYSIAFSRVAQANPELHREYLNENGEVS